MTSTRMVAFVGMSVLMIAGCRTSTTTPTPPTEPGSSGIVLADGDYTLGISLGALPPSGGAPTFCQTVGPLPGVPVPMNAAFPARLTGTATGWTVRTTSSGSNLEFSLVAGAARTVSGTISGAATVPDGSLTMTVPASRPITGSQVVANGVGGRIDGEVRFANATNALTCNSNSWTLTLR